MSHRVKGKTCLTVEDADIVKESLEARADPNILMDGRGPLHEACIWRAGEAVVRLLLERAANPLFSGTYKKRQG